MHRKHSAPSVTQSIIIIFHIEQKKKIMKRCREHNRYPSKEVLDHLADTFQFEKLELRVKDRTNYNLIQDKMDARKERRSKNNHDWKIFPTDILFIIAVYMDIRQVLDLAKKSTIFASFTSQNLFWRRRFYLDLPEVRYMLHQRKLLLCPVFSGKTVEQKYLGWKKFYFVFHYMLHHLFKSALFDDTVVGNVKFLIRYDYFERIFTVRTKIDETEFGSMKRLNLTDVVEKILKLCVPNINRVNYLELCLNKRDVWIENTFMGDFLQGNMSHLKGRLERGYFYTGACGQPRLN
jgi:hypothetical protein